MDGPIVVGTDGSATATRALSEAILLAKSFEQPLHVVCSYKPISVNPKGIPAEYVDTVKPDSAVQSVLDDATARARRHGVSVTEHARTGDPADAILELAEEIDAALIVVGNKGISSVRRYVLGNVPSKVVHHAPCSTFVVHTTEP